MRANIMTLSIKQKLFFTLLLIPVMVVTIMFAFMYYSVDRDMDPFKGQQRQIVINTIIQRLTTEYKEKGNWDNLHRHPSAWQKLVQEGTLDLFPPNNPHGQPFIPGDVSFQPRVLLPPISVEGLFVLLDKNKTVVNGQMNLKKEELKLYPIKLGNKAVGFLGVSPQAMQTDAMIKDIKKNLIHTFMLVAFAMTALSSLLSLLLANWLAKPLLKIATAARELAKGHYEHRLPIQTKDELGRLAFDFNDLANSLSKTEQSRRHWVADISHELRTPLALMQGQLEALQDGIRPLNLVAINLLQEDVLRLNRLVDDLYELSLSDQGALTYHKVAVDPISILQSDLEILAIEFVELGIKVDLKNYTHHDPITLFADPLRLSQLYCNLLNNALLYTDAGGKLRISFVRQQDKIIITFEDSAPSVPINEIPKLFERFYRVETSRNRAYGGAGLGLAICQNIVEAHQGEITAYCSPLGGLGLRIEMPALL